MTDSSRPSFSLRDILAQIRRRFPWPPAKPPVGRPDPHDMGAERARAQVSVIRKAYREDQIGAAGSEGTEPVKDDADADFLYRKGHMLVRDGDDFALLDRFFNDRSRRELFFGDLKRAQVPTPGLVLVEVPSRRDQRDDVLTTLNEIDQEFKERSERGDPLARPDHVLYVTAIGRFCPDTEPEVPRGTTPVPALSSDPTAGEGVGVAVVDTGWWKDAAKHKATPWVSDVTADPDDEEVLVGTTIHEYAGHGTFVAGVIKCLAPEARVEIEGALPNGGAVTESEICEQLQQALRDNNLPQIVSISAGTHTRKNMGLLGLEILAANKGLDDGVKTIVVAAAGNDTTDLKFYPAAYDWVVGVGSVDPDGKRSKFSNYGDWVKVYARGRDLVNAFPVGTYTCHYPENKTPQTQTGTPDVRQFDGLARWSGTSFATPVVAGAIAAHMSATGNLTEPWKAYQELLQAAQTGPGGEKIIGPL